MNFILIGSVIASVLFLSIKPFLKWIYVPIKIRRKNPIPIDPGYQPTTSDQLTPEQREVIREFIPQCISENFEVVANVLLKQGPGEPSALLVLLVNRSTNDVAQMIMASINLRRNLTLSIRSHFSDGSDVLTGFNPQPGFMPPNPQVDSMNFSWVREFVTLAEAHRRRLHLLGFSNRPRQSPPPGQEIVYLRENRKIEISRFISSGYFFRDDTAGLLRKTWKGTFLTAWKLQQPVKKIRIAFRNRKARRMWLQLGMDKWLPTSSPVTEPLPVDDAPSSGGSNESPAVVPYQTLLQPGELTIEQHLGATIIRMGNPSVGSYLLLRWASMIPTLFFGFSLLGNLFMLWFWLRFIFTTNIPLQWENAVVPILLIVVFLLFLTPLLSVLRGLRQVGGTSTITVSTASFSFEHAPSRRSRGSIQRRDLSNLVVRRSETHVFKSLYQLQADIVNNATPQPLLVSSNIAKLRQAKDALATALGMTQIS